jgi:tetratricopeptide (TPR) repeat protein
LALGDLFLDLSQPDSARAHFEAARTLLEAMRREQQDDARIPAALGLTYASLGRRGEALASARAAVRMMPVEREALRGASFLDNLARTFARLGDKEAALEVLDELFSLRNARIITPALARLDPDWRGLRGDARFEMLLRRVERGGI